MNAKIVSHFEPISLEKLDQVKLMERMDRKFLVPISKLPAIFKSIEEDYYILQINDKRLLQYQTHYFDTDDDHLYNCHHNGKLNRYKVRKRTYIDTATSFLEVKFKTNKGKTIKKRLVSSESNAILTPDEKEFLRPIFPITPEKLKPKSINRFQRITLADKQLSERCTIDLNLQFVSQNSRVDHDDFAIIELKRDRYSQESKLHSCLRENRIKSTGFSKYCLGRVLAEENLKTNCFKPKVRMLNKLIHQ